MPRILDFFDGFTSASNPTTTNIAALYDAIIDPSASSIATHTSLASYLLVQANGDRVLILGGETLNANPVLTASNVWIETFGDVTYTKGTATIGLQITGDRNRITGLRFSGFSAGGDKGVDLTAAAAYNRLLSFSFLNCTSTVVDAGTDNQVLGTIIE